METHRMIESRDVSLSTNGQESVLVNPWAEKEAGAESLHLLLGQEASCWLLWVSLVTQDGKLHGCGLYSPFVIILHFSFVYFKVSLCVCVRIVRGSRLELNQI